MHTASTGWPHRINHKAVAALLLFAAGASALYGQFAQTNLFPGVNLPIPDGSVSGTQDVRSVVSDILQITSVRVRLTIGGQFNGDLYGYLRHASGTATNLSVLLNRPGRETTKSNDRGYGDDGFEVTFDDLAAHDVHTYREVTNPPAGSPLYGTWQPDARLVDPALATNASPRGAYLSGFNGLDASGEWTLFLADVDGGANSTNLLNSWGLEIAGKVRPTITWTNPADIVYGTALGTNQLNASVAVSGTFAYNPPAGTLLPAGTNQTLSVTFIPDDTNSYVEATASVPVTVETATLVVSADHRSRPYGATNPVLTVTYSGFVNGEDTNVLSGTPILTTLAETNSPVGTYLVEIAQGTLASTNYTFAFTNGTLTVTAAELTVSANNQSRAYGATNPVLAATYSGFVNGEDTNALSGTPLLTTLAETNSPTGNYPIEITQGTLASTNYSFTFTNGTLTVTPTLLAVAADHQSRSYGTTNPVLTVTYSGFVNSEDANVLSGAPVLTTPAETASPVGAYPIEITQGTLASTNYTFAFTNGTLTVTQAVCVSSLVSSANPAELGATVTITVSLTALPPNGGTPSGAVQFRVDGTNYGSSVPLTNGQASLSTSTLAAGERAIAVYYAGDSNFLGATAVLDSPQFIISAPVAAADILPRVLNHLTRMPVSALLANDSDADGDTIVFDSADAVTPAGSTVSQTNNWIFYTPTNGFADDDSFHYVVHDSHGRYATGTVAVVVQVDREAAARLTLLDLGDGTFRVISSGLPWGNYKIESTDSLLSQPWGTLALGAADLWGDFIVDDFFPSETQSRCYRAVYEGDGTLTLPFRFSLASSANPAPPGSNVTFTASLVPFSQGTVAASGTVQFRVDGALWGDPVVLAGSSASLDTTNLALGEHRVSAEYSGDTNYQSAVCVLARFQVINTPPIIGLDVLQRSSGHGVKVLLSDLLANDSEADGDPLFFEGISSTSAEGGLLTVAEGWVFYTPPAGFAYADSFTYQLRDNRGGTTTATVEILPRVSTEASSNYRLVDLGGGTYRIAFSGVPWRVYTIQYAESQEQTNWVSIATNTADSHGLFAYEDALPPGSPSRTYRSISQSAGATASPFRLVVWTNFVAHTNGRTMEMWSVRTTNNPPTLAWNTNCLLYGLEGFTGISQRNQFEGLPGQVPVTLLTRRHGYTRGHGLTTNGLHTILAGLKVWFCTADNAVVEMSVAAEFIRLESSPGSSYDYSLVVFTEDVPESISPVRVVSLVDMEIYYWNTPDLPYLFLGTEQGGHCAAGVPPFVYDIMKGGDSGSPNMIPSPDNKLIMFSGRGTSGFSAQMQADINALSVHQGLNTNNYQLRWYDLSPWEP